MAKTTTDKNLARQRKLLRAPKIGFNAEVYTWFKDLETTPNRGRTALRDSLLILPKDSRTSAMFKIQYFRQFVQKTHLKSEVFIDMTDRVYEGFTMRPEVSLYFYKKVKIAAGHYELNKGFISYRLTNETSASLTPASNRRRAEKIKELFGEPTQFVWHKGHIKYTYLDTIHGYDFRFLATTESEAKRVITQVMHIENHTPEWDLLKTHTSEKKFTETKQKKYIYGKERDVPRWRPTVSVPFVEATMKIHGIPSPITLVSYLGNTPTIPSMVV